MRDLSVLQQAYLYSYYIYEDKRGLTGF